MLGIVLLITAMLAPVAVGAPAVLADTHGSFAQTDDDAPEPDAISMTIHLPGDDRGLWTIEHRYRLADDADRQAFDELAADIDADESGYVDRFTTRMNGTVSDAASAAGRDMTIDNVTIETETRAIPQDYGIVRYRFDWHGFASHEAGRLKAGDAIAGFFLDDGTSLHVRWPDDAELEAVRPATDAEGDRSVEWRGPTEFGGDEPRITLTEGDATTAPAVSTWMMALGIVALVVIVGGGVWVVRRDHPTDEPAPPDQDQEQEPEPDPEPQREPVPPDELLSNEEQVLQLLEERGGRMKQQEVVETLGWTDAKTSQVVSTLREEDQLESFRLGRENVLRLPDVDDADIP